MTLDKFIDKIKQGEEAISFHETIVVITENYFYNPTEFRNGLNEDMLTNAAGTNEGSCKIFAFAKLHKLSKDQTLSLFGDYYRTDVLNNPNGNDHQNIRTFMKYGWDGITYQAEALAAKNS